MLRQFDLGFETHEIATSGIMPIKYNIIKRLNKLKYVTYSKIDISITDKNDKGMIDIWWDDKKKINIKYFIGRKILSEGADDVSMGSAYKARFNCLEIIWGKNNWGTRDLGIICSGI